MLRQFSIINRNNIKNAYRIPQARQIILEAFAPNTEAMVFILVCLSTSASLISKGSVIKKMYTNWLSHNRKTSILACKFNPDSIAGNMTEVVLHTTAIKNIFTYGKSLSFVGMPKGFKTGKGYNTDIPPINSSMPIVFHFNKSVKTNAPVPEIMMVILLNLGCFSNH